MLLKHQILMISVLIAAGLNATCSKAPKIEKVDAKQQQVEPGRTVKLVGENFGQDVSKLEVKVDDKLAEVKKVDDQNLEVTVPEDTGEGTHKIVVRNKETQAESLPVEIKVEISSPEIAEITPESVRSGGVLKVQGTHFNPVAEEMDAKLGNEKVLVTAITATSAELRVPENMDPGMRDLVFTDLKTGKSSSPQKVQVTELVQIPPGSELHVKTAAEIGSASNQPGDRVSMVLAAPLGANGKIIASPDNAVTGRVTFVNQPGKVKGKAAIGFTIEKIDLDTHDSVAVQTNDFNSQAPSGKKKDTKKVLVTTGIGTLVGAIAGGGKGAAIGAAVGAGAGSTVVLLTKGDHVVIPEKSPLIFVLQKPLEVELTQPIAVTANKN